MRGFLYEDARANARGRQIVDDNAASVLLPESIFALRISHHTVGRRRFSASTVLSNLRKTPRVIGGN